MNKDRQHLRSVSVASSYLAGFYSPFYYWINNFKMRGVEGQREINRPARSGNVAGKSLMVFYVAGGKISRMFALELRKKV